VLFGDGAGAALLAPTRQGAGFLSFDLGSDGSGAALLRVDACRGRSVDGGTVGRVTRMAGAEVFKFAVRQMEESTRRALEKGGLSVADVDCYIAHQANIRIIDAAARRLGLPEERVYNNVARYGNTSAASIPIALAEACSAGMIRPGSVVVLCGFGAGLSWASAVLRWA
jgi:3-oxoacyl-[acyl-carrier-protein] synthase-3